MYHIFLPNAQLNSFAIHFSTIIGNFGSKLSDLEILVIQNLTGNCLNTCKPLKNTDFKKKIQTLIVQSLDEAFIGHSFNRTDQREYFQYLKAFLLLIEPIVNDLKLKGFI